MPVDSDLREAEEEARLDEDRLPAERRHRAVHQRVALDEVQHVCAQFARVVRALLQHKHKETFSLEIFIFTGICFSVWSRCITVEGRRDGKIFQKRFVGTGNHFFFS